MSGSLLGFQQTQVETLGGDLTGALDVPKLIEILSKDFKAPLLEP